MVGPPWIAVLGSGPRVDADNRSHTNPLTGKPDAGDPPVRFGGRGSGKPLSLPLSLSFAKDSGPEAFKGESKALGRADYFPFNRAAAYWRFIREMNSRLISFGQTASQEPVTVQLPNPSASID